MKQIPEEKFVLLTNCLSLKEYDTFKGATCSICELFAARNDSWEGKKPHLLKETCVLSVLQELGNFEYFYVQKNDLRVPWALFKTCVLKFIISQAHGNTGEWISEAGSVRVLLGRRGWCIFCLCFPIYIFSLLAHAELSLTPRAHPWLSW